MAVATDWETLYYIMWCGNLHSSKPITESAQQARSAVRIFFFLLKFMDLQSALYSTAICSTSFMGEEENGGKRAKRGGTKSVGRVRLRGGERERETDRDRQTETETRQRDRERKRDRQAETDRVREIQTDIERDWDRQTDRERQRQTDRER